MRWRRRSRLPRARKHLFHRLRAALPLANLSQRTYDAAYHVRQEPVRCQLHAQEVKRHHLPRAIRASLHATDASVNPIIGSTVAIAVAAGFSAAATFASIRCTRHRADANAAVEHGARAKYQQSRARHRTAACHAYAYCHASMSLGAFTLREGAEVVRAFQGRQRAAKRPEIQPARQEPAVAPVLWMRSSATLLQKVAILLLHGA